MDTPNFTTVSTAFDEMRGLQERLDANAGKMVEMLVGRLRKARYCSDSLAKLKRELQDFNMQTHSWKA